MEKNKTVVSKHPYLSAWFVLALGMVLILVYEARNVGLEASQWFFFLADHDHHPGGRSLHLDY
ncbi:MAG: hypothetical protein M5U34_48825 [Chloroflexi bacterium]|nr:hypothetical protein [Chloroflexota bacterium]